MQALALSFCRFQRATKLPQFLSKGVRFLLQRFPFVVGDGGYLADDLLVFFVQGLN